MKTIEHQNTQPVIVIGGIGTGTNIVQAIYDANKRGDNSLNVVGFMSHDKAVGEYIEGVPVFAAQSRENVLCYYEMGYKYIFALHRMDGGDYFHKLYYDLGLTSDMMATFIHPFSYVAPNVKIGKGVAILPFCSISSATTVSDNTLMMAGAMVGHNSEIGPFNHIAAHSSVGSYVKTGVGVHTGLNSTIREYLTIGDNSTIGMGAVLLKDVGDREIWVGNPAKFLRKVKQNADNKPVTSIMGGGKITLPFYAAYNGIAA